MFDTSLVIGGRIVLRERHVRRLLVACEAFGLKVSEDDIEALAESAVASGSTGALRLTITRGPGARGLAGETASHPTLMASFTPQTVNYPASSVRLGVSAIQRNPTAPSARYKTLSYVDAVQGQRQALQSGFDDALYLTPAGNIACSSIANVWARFGSDLVTPPVTDGVVSGVMRGWILENAAQSGLKVSERSLSLEDVAKADGVFLTNSLRLAVPVSAIDDMTFESGLPPELSAMIGDLLSV